MKAALFLFAVAAAGAGYYVHTRPAPHHFAPAGTYYLRTYYSMQTPGGIIGWGPGQELHRDANAVSAPGTIAVTDGQCVAQLPVGMLTDDQEDAAALRTADTTAQQAATTQVATVHARQAYMDQQAAIDSARSIEISTQRQGDASANGGATDGLMAPPQVAGADGWVSYGGSSVVVGTARTASQSGGTVTRTTMPTGAAASHPVQSKAASRPAQSAPVSRSTPAPRPVTTGVGIYTTH